MNTFTVLMLYYQYLITNNSYRANVEDEQKERRRCLSLLQKHTEKKKVENGERPVLL